MPYADRFGVQSLRGLANRAYTLFGEDKVDVLMFLIWVEQGWSQLVHRVGGVYLRDVEVAVAPDSKSVALPSDIRVIKRGGVYLWYDPRTVSSATVVSGTCTIETSVAHSLSPGHLVSLLGADDSIDGQITVATTPTATSFTFITSAENGVFDSGTVNQTFPRTQLTYTEYEGQLESGFDDLFSSGLPSNYCVTNFTSLKTIPLPDSSVLAIHVIYDGESPTNIVDTDPLPVPSYVQQSLIYYAMFKAAETMRDPQRAQLFMSEYEAGLNQFQQATFDRQMGFLNSAGEI